jgi:hypothetical protein
MKMAAFCWLARPQVHTSTLAVSSREMRENGYLQNLLASERYRITPELRDSEAGWIMMVTMDALDEEYKDFDEDALFADTRKNIRAGLVELHQAHVYARRL